jgi:hypothetical protein
MDPHDTIRQLAVLMAGRAAAMDHEAYWLEPLSADEWMVEHQGTRLRVRVNPPFTARLSYGNDRVVRVLRPSDGEHSIPYGFYGFWRGLIGARRFDEAA